MDGNGRYAEVRGLPRPFGHIEGAKRVRDIVDMCGQLGLTALTVFAFSSDNWKRPGDEVDTMMELIAEYIAAQTLPMKDGGVRFRLIGDKNGLPENVRLAAQRCEKITGQDYKMTFNVCINYGSRPEIVRAVKNIARSVVEQEISIDEIDEKLISDNLYTAGLPDPELVIRTSGEQRVSNFLLYQIAYSELYFSGVLWPDFTKDELAKALVEFSNRKRRFGGL